MLRMKIFKLFKKKTPKVKELEFIRLDMFPYNGKPYYSIVYRDNKTGEICEGYSSYSLGIVSRFLRDYFINPKEGD